MLPMAAMSQGPPAKCTGTTARVRSVTAASKAAGSRFSDSGSISTNTGVAPVCTIAFVVAGQVKELVTTSSPGPTPVATSDRWMPVVHEDVAIACGAPVYSANPASSSLTRGPDVSQPERRVATTASISSSPSSGGANSSSVSRTGVPPSIAGRVSEMLLIEPRISPPRWRFSLARAPPAGWARSHST